MKTEESNATLAVGSSDWLAEAFDAAVELGCALGISKINELDGAWICEVDKRWTFAINGRDKPVEVNIADSMGIGELKPFHMAVWFNGWLAGLLTPAGGTMCAGEAGNEDNFIAAVRARIAEASANIRTEAPRE